MTEKDWQRQVVELAKTLGYRRPMHIYDSRRSEPGWPDLTLVNTQKRRFVLLELKTETGLLSQAQATWIQQLDAVGVEVYVVRPRHLDMLATVLQARGHPDYPHEDAREDWKDEQMEARHHLLLERDSLTAKYAIPY